MAASSQLLPWAPYSPQAALQPPLQRAALAAAQVAVVGLGVAGLAMAKLLQACGAKLVLVDARQALAGPLAASFPTAQLRLGQTAPDALAGCNWVALSPGVDPRAAFVAAAIARGAHVFGEVELIALRHQAACTLAITGTNGKSTTTALCGALLQAVGAAAFVGGNLGTALSDWVRDPAGPDRAVLELSSYQVDGAHAYAPHVAAVLNLAPDHLARYGDVAHYAHSKRRLLERQTHAGIAVLNADDPAVRAMAPAVRGEVLWFGTTAPLPGPGLLGSGDQIQVVGAHACSVDLRACAGAWPHPVLVGRHNQQNTLAALLASSALLHLAPLPEPAGERAQALHQGHAGFAGLPHRLAPVATCNDVLWLDDSKATNDASAATAVLAMARPCVLLLGGQDDPSDALPQLLAALAIRPPRAIVTFGGAGARLGRLLAASKAAFAGPVQVAASLQDACVAARTLAQPGDAVLLSPGCKSFDAFANYSQRGEVFAAWVQANAKLA